MHLRNLKIPEKMVLCPASGFRHGFGHLMNAYNSQRVGAATIALGIAAGAYELALDWVKERRQFGRPIAEFQGLQWMLADMAIGLEASRAMIQKAAASRGPNGSQFPDPTLAAMAKVLSSETAIKVTNDALQLFGARGYSRALPLERMLRDVRMFTIGGGTAQVLRTLVASSILGISCLRRAVDMKKPSALVRLEALLSVTDYKAGTFGSLGALVPGIALCALVTLASMASNAWRSARLRIPTSRPWQSLSCLEWRCVPPASLLTRAMAGRHSVQREATPRSGCYVARRLDQLRDDCGICSASACYDHVHGLVVALGTGFGLSRLLGLPTKLSILIACGNSICGNSAIAAVAPVIGADGDDIASSISFTAILGVLMVLGLPLLIPL